MESKGCKRLATTEAEMEEKRLKLNAERTIRQNKSIAYNFTVTCIMCAVPYIMQDILTGVLGHLWLLGGYF
jgi:hypothetical protein